MKNWMILLVIFSYLGVHLTSCNSRKEEDNKTQTFSETSSSVLKSEPENLTSKKDTKPLEEFAPLASEKPQDLSLFTYAAASEPSPKPYQETPLYTPAYHTPIEKLEPFQVSQSVVNNYFYTPQERTFNEPVEINPQPQSSPTRSAYSPNGFFSVNLLILKPSMDQSSFVISSNRNNVGDEVFPNGKRYLNQTSYNPGVRLETGTQTCSCANLNLRWSYFNAGYSSSVTGDFLYDTVGFPGDGAQSPEDIFYAGTARIRDKFRYNAVELTLSRSNLLSCVENLYFLFGLQYASIHHSTDFNSAGVFPDGSVSTPFFTVLGYSSNFWGIGPELGAEYYYTITPLGHCCGSLSLGITARGALLCSTTEADLHYASQRTAGSAGVNLENEDLWRVTPAFDTTLELNYQFCYRCWDFSLALGYEWIWYSDAIDFIRGIDVAFAGDSIDLYSNFSLQGPYIKASVSF